MVEIDVDHFNVNHEFNLVKLPSTKKELDMVEIGQLIHVDHFNMKHESNLDKRPSTTREVDMVEIAQPICKVKHMFDSNKLPSNDEEPHRDKEIEEIVKYMLKIILPMYSKIKN